MEIQKTILGNLLLANTLEKQKAISNLLIEEFFTGENKEILKLIKEENKKGILADPRLIDFEKNYLYDCISQSTLISSTKEAFLKLKDDYLSRTAQNLSNLNDFVSIKANILEAEKKAQILDYTKPKSIFEIITDSFEISNHDLENLTKTGFTDFDREFMGFLEGQLCTIGGYSGIGKSTFLFSLIKNLAFNHRTLIFNLEMDNFIISARILSSLSGVPFLYCASLGNAKIQENIHKYGLSKKLSNGITNIEKLNLRMIDNQFNIAQISNSIRKEVKENNLKFVLIDYLQLITTNSAKQRHLEIGEITRELKLLAKELKITIIILAQLGRASLTREEPEIQDLRESGSIEMDSDLVFLIYKKQNDRWIKLAKDRMFGKFHKAKLNYDNKTQSYV